MKRETRKHPAPQGELRLIRQSLLICILQLRKYPAPQGALRRSDEWSRQFPRVRKHPAPEGALRRCAQPGHWATWIVRKHPAPEGALRPLSLVPVRGPYHVRKHPAPEGALRHNRVEHGLARLLRQKAPSTRRCIKTRNAGGAGRSWCPSESTQHQKVH